MRVELHYNNGQINLFSDQLYDRVNYPFGIAEISLIYPKNMITIRNPFRSRRLIYTNDNFEPGVFILKATYYTSFNTLMNVSNAVMQIFGSTYGEIPLDQSNRPAAEIWIVEPYGIGSSTIKLFGAAPSTRDWREAEMSGAIRLYSASYILDAVYTPRITHSFAFTWEAMG